MRWLGLMLGCGLLLSSPALLAQGEIRGDEVGEGEGEETIGESRIARINRIERGLYLDLEYGPFYQVALADAPQKMCLPCIGTQIGVRFGYDILNNLAVGWFLRGSYAQFQTDPTVPYSGDLASYYTGISARFSYITADTFHATVRGGVGPAVFTPTETAGSPSIPVGLGADLGLGIEYFTRLRHLSIGIEFSTMALMADTFFNLGFALLPTVKMTF